MEVIPVIKIFGKIRYHWQPELSWLIVYWSITITPIFLGLSLLYERARIPYQLLILFALFVILVGIGFHRYFIIEDEDVKIVSFSVFTPSKIAIADIQKIEITKHSLMFVTDKYPKGKIFYMRKWPKKYFLDALAVHPKFTGEVELLDNFIKLDYFDHYQK